MFPTKLFAAIAVFALLIAGAGYAGAQETGENLDVTSHKDHDQLLAEIGNTVSEFGGFFVSRNGDTDVLNIYLASDETNTDKQEDAQDAVEDKFGVVTGARLNIIKGDYTIAQLSNWYSSMQTDVWGHSDVVATDPEEQSNRLEIGILDLSKKSEILAILTKLEIPHAAVKITQRARMVKEHTIRERANNNEMMGAYQVKVVNVGLCSIGFVTEKAGVAGFVTAGHCTENSWDGGTNNVAFYQPTNTNTSHKVGNEAVDPTFSAITGCPAGKTCRKSDSAFIRFDSGVSYHRGYIAKPNANNSIDVASGDQLKVKYEGGTVYPGKALRRFGRSSGYVFGNITDTCENTYEAGNRMLLCQYLISMTSHGGDSGAPYYEQAGSETDVRLYGIHVGKIPSTGKGVISQLVNIYQDLGQNDNWRSCASPYSC